MTLRECYESFGGNYNDVLTRLVDDKRVEKFALKFLNDGSYGFLKESLDKKDYNEAFRAAHTLKGVCQNLSFEALYKSVFEVTEALRGGKELTDMSLMDAVDRDYERLISALNEYKNERM